MEHLWAPWRVEYFQRKKPIGCIFCNASSQKDSEGEPRTDEEIHVVTRERSCFVILNRYPYSCGHLMIAPYRHTGELEDLTDDELKDMMVLARRCKQWLAKAFRAEGFNIGLNLGTASGAGIAEHIHLHIVPRWNGDTNFMTVVNDLRVVPEGLDAAYKKILEQLHA
jgi:ATP adenylyltransferase